jgi:hypothetical protein
MSSNKSGLSEEKVVKAKISAKEKQERSTQLELNRVMSCPSLELEG